MLDYIEEILYAIVAIPLFVMSIKEINEDLKHNYKDSRLITHIAMAIIFGLLIVCGIFILIGAINKN